MQIRIKSYTFSLSEPFQPGTVITKAEAQALNDLRSENIQNNLRKAVADAVAVLGPDELLSQEALAELQAKFTAYDNSYTFTERHTPKPRLGDIEAEARAVARERVEVLARRVGETLSEADVDAAVAEMAGLPAIVEEARMRVSARRRVLGEGLDSL